MTELAHLPDRGVIEVAGADRVDFLQGLVSNDVAQVTPGHAVWAALLTPQGKWLADFFILADGDRLLIDCERSQLPDLARRLSRYRLRAKVTVTETPLQVYTAWNGPWAASPGQIGAADPRLPDAGWRILSLAELPTTTDRSAWNRHRLTLGLPDGSHDLEAEKTVLLEAGFDALHGVSWTKGCYMGQELTARTKYRGLVKRRLTPVEVEGPLPPAGTPVFAGMQEVGTMRSGQDGLGMAVLRLERPDGLLTAGKAVLRARS